MDGNVFVYKSINGEPVVCLDGPDEIIWMDWHPLGNILLCGALNGTMWMWMIPSGVCMNVFSGHSGFKTFMKLSNVYFD